MADLGEQASVDPRSDAPNIDQFMMPVARRRSQAESLALCGTRLVSKVM